MCTLVSRRTQYFLRKSSVILSVLFLTFFIIIILSEPEERNFIRHDIGLRQLPIHYWRHLSKKPAGFFNDSCTFPPSVKDIEIVNGFWQRVNAVNAKILIFSAFWDDRGSIPWIRVLMYSQTTPVPRLYCQLWYEHENSPVIVRGTVTYSWVGNPEEETSEPYIISCLGRRNEYHNADHMLMAVSIVTSPCNRATTLLTVQNARHKQSNWNRTIIKEEDSVAVCLIWRKDEWMMDYSARLIEWLELMKYFGTKHVHVYVPQVHPKVLRVIIYYVKKQFVTWSHLILPPEGYDLPMTPLSDEAKRKAALISYTDCLYSAMKYQKWVAMLKIDDLLVPDRDQSYITMIYRELKEKNHIHETQSTDGFVFEPFWVPSFAQREITGNVSRTPFLSSEWRAPLRFAEGWRHRFFFNLDTLLAILPHQPLTCIKSNGLPRKCNTLHISSTTALVRQYSLSCGKKSPVICKNIEEKVVQDMSLQYIRYTVQEKVDILLSEMGIE